MTVHEKRIIEALEKRQDYILSNLENMTMKALRSVLEQDLELEEDALKPMKKTVSGFVDNLLAKARCEELTKENVGERKMSNQAGKRDSDRKEERWTKRFIKMRNICKQATITIPPLVYRKGSDPKEMESALLNLLKKHGLDESSTKSSITAAKEKLQMTRDLDGIDSGNIIDDGRRLRRKAFRYIEDHSSSEEREQDSTEEEGNGNNSSSEQNFSEDEQEVVVSASRAKRVKTIDEWSEEE